MSKNLQKEKITSDRNFPQIRKEALFKIYFYHFSYKKSKLTKQYIY